MAGMGVAAATRPYPCPRNLGYTFAAIGKRGGNDMSNEGSIRRARVFMPNLVALAVAAGSVLTAGGAAGATVDPALFKALH
jgi:hypothetical protein